MSPEQQPEKKLSKGAKRRVRELKRDTRREIGITQPSPDSTAWTRAEEILRLKLADYDQKFSPHYTILRDFFEIRQQIAMGGSLELIKEFQTRYNPEVITELKPALILIREIVGK